MYRKSNTLYTRLINSSYRHPKYIIIVHKSYRYNIIICICKMLRLHMELFFMSIHCCIQWKRLMLNKCRSSTCAKTGLCDILKKGVYHVPCFLLFYVWWKNELLTAELRWLHLFITLTKIGIITVMNKKVFYFLF